MKILRGMVVIYLQTYIWDALHSCQCRVSVVVMSQYFASETVVTLESILDGLSMRLPNVSIQERRDCVMDLSTNIDSMVGISSEIADMLKPAPNEFT